MTTAVLVHVGQINQHASSFLTGMRNYQVSHALDWDIRVPVTADFQQPDPSVCWVLYQMNEMKRLSGISEQATVCALFGHPDDDHQPCMTMNQQAYGQLAARHFAELGYQHVVVLPRTNINQQLNERRVGFLSGCKKFSLQVQEFRRDDSIDPTALLHFLTVNHRPLGIFALTDGEARWLRDILLATGIHIPHDIAILGTGNNLSKCLEREPYLSSISLPWQLIGESAAMWIHRKLQGITDVRPQTMRPYHIVSRASTPRIRKHTPEVVAKAERWLAANLQAKEPLKDCARALATSPATLCRQFKRNLNTSPQKYHSRLRTDKACALLRQPTLSIGSIAAQVGFRSANQFSIAFRKRFGCSPSAWRKTINEASS